MYFIYFKNEENYTNYGIGVVPGLSNHIDY